MSRALPLAASAARRAGFYYGWVVVATSFLTLAFHITGRFSFSLFYVAMLEEFGWGRALLAGAFSVQMFVYALASPFMGAALDRVGPRRMFPLASLILGAALVAMSLTGSLLWVYLFVGVVMPFGIAAAGFGQHAAVMARWFDAKRGRATGIALSGIGVGLLVFAPILQRLIALVGWRGTYLLFGLAIVLLVLPLNLLFMRDRPEELGLAKDGQEPHAAPPVGGHVGGPERPQGLLRTFLALRGDPRFWFLAFLVFSIGVAANMVLVHVVAYLVDTGTPRLLAAFIFGLVGILRTGGSVLGGFVADYLGRPRAAALAALAEAAGMGLLMALPHLPPSYSYLFALVFGVAFGAMSTSYASMVGDFFRGSNLGTIMGILEVCYGLGGVVGPWAAGAVFDLAGSYQPAFAGVLLLLLTASALCARLVPRLIARAAG